MKEGEEGEEGVAMVLYSLMVAEESACLVVDEEDEEDVED